MANSINIPTIRVVTMEFGLWLAQVSGVGRGGIFKISPGN
jgi:hypothetical protein